MNQRILLAIIAVLAATVAWLLSQRATPPPAAPPTALPTSSPTSAPDRTAATPNPEFRLAGTVIGDVEYAIIESPDGGNKLYHIGDQVPGLGKLLSVRGTSATFRGRAGDFDLPVLAAPNATRRPVGMGFRGTRIEVDDLPERADELPEDLDADADQNDYDDYGLEDGYDDADTYDVDEDGYDDY